MTREEIIQRLGELLEDTLGASRALTEELRKAGYEVLSGPRTTGDGYYESCIAAVEGNPIEITV